MNRIVSSKLAQFQESMQLHLLLSFICFPLLVFCSKQSNITLLYNFFLSNFDHTLIKKIPHNYVKIIIHQHKPTLHF